MNSCAFLPGNRNNGLLFHSKLMLIPSYSYFYSDLSSFLRCRTLLRHADLSSHVWTKPFGALMKKTKQQKHTSPSDTGAATLSDYWSILLRSISFRGVKSHLWCWSVISLSAHLDIKLASGLEGNSHEGGAGGLLVMKKTIWLNK